VLLTGKRWFPRQQDDINRAEQVAAAEEVHEESYAVCHHDQGSSVYCITVITVYH